MITPELITALINVQSEIQHAGKDGKNPYFGSEYATLEAVISAVKPVLNKYGVMFQQLSSPNDHGAAVETVFYGHGGFLSSGVVSLPTDKRDPQAFGGALTYAKRYSLALACGIGHQRDDDLEKAMESFRKVEPEKNKSHQDLPPKLQAHIEAQEGAIANGYIIQKGKVVIVSCDTPETFLAACRLHLGEVQTESCQTMYLSSKEYIHKAIKNSNGTIKEALETLKGLYE